MQTKMCPIRHECYIAVTKRSAIPKHGSLYIFYDFECYQTKLLIENDQSKKEHEVNLCVAHQVCKMCSSNPDSDISCNLCGERQHIFWGDNIIDDCLKNQTE